MGDPQNAMGSEPDMPAGPRDLQHVVPVELGKLLDGQQARRGVHGCDQGAGRRVAEPSAGRTPGLRGEGPRAGRDGTPAFPAGKRVGFSGADGRRLCNRPERRRSLRLGTLRA